MKPFVASVLAAGVLLAACRADHAGPPRSTSVSTDTVPFLDVASTARDGTPLLDQVAMAVRLPDGRLLVADQMAHHLILFDSLGAPVTTIGREGKGPGEFAWPTWMGRCAGDSIFVWDPQLSRMTVIGPGGTAAREFHFYVRPAFVSCFPGGKFALLLPPQQMFMVDHQGHSPPMQSKLAVAGGDGDSVAVLGTVQLGQTRPLGLLTHIVSGGHRLYLGTGDSGWVDVYDSAGAKAGALPVAGPRRPPTRADYEHEIDRQLSVFGPGDREPARTQMLSIPMPDLLPAYRALLTDPAGAVWAVTSGPGDSVTTVRGTTSGGRSLGELHFPDRFTPFEIGADYVLGVAQTADGEQHVREYRLRRARDR